ncbi:MAG: hypothetical protein ACKOUM_00585 [Sphingopyxis sp.]
MTQNDQPHGGEDHYQPWLRQPDGSQPAGAPIHRPQPLPTTAPTTLGANHAVPPSTDGANMPNAADAAARGTTRMGQLSADQLLARPVPIPPMPQQGPAMGQRVTAYLRGAMDAARAWAGRADVPGRIQRLNMGDRVRDAGAKAASIMGEGAEKGARAARDAVAVVERAGGAAAPKIRSVATAASDGLTKTAQHGAAKMGEAARKLADAAPGVVPGAGRAPAPDAAIESQLDRLLADEDKAARPAAPSTHAGSGLPLFSERVDAPAAAQPPATPQAVTPQAVTPPRQRRRQRSTRPCPCQRHQRQRKQRRQ